MTMTAVAKGTDYYHHANQATRQSEQQGHPHAVANMVSTRLSILVDDVYIIIMFFIIILRVHVCFACCNNGMESKLLVSLTE